ncbi:MAG: rhomboid family intramembrane serine protease [Roseburia sp.]|nr:rhomboid family intramembrane serine protease [Roseburia sp.]
MARDDSRWKDCCITILFLVLNVGAYLLYTAAGEIVYNTGNLNAAAVLEDGEYYRLVSCVFLHGSIDHIIGNMIFLAALGKMLESRIGHVRFFLLYLFSGVGGSIFSLVYMTVSMAPYRSVGASGAISGLIGALLLLVVVNSGRYEGISLPRILLAIFYMVYTGLRSETTDNAAHIGGLVCGFVIMLVIEIHRLGARALGNGGKGED